MSRIRSANTKPERTVRSLLHAMGYRFRLHRRDLPGRPDIVLPRHQAVIFVHGCFWHLHRCRRGQVTPRTNSQFWQEKREGNRARDRRNTADLRKAGWRVLVVWECWLKEPETKLIPRLLNFLSHSDD